MTVNPDRPGVMCVAICNLEFGGLSGSGDDSGWRKSMQALAGWVPDLVLLQEMTAPRPWQVRGHLRRTANTLGMAPVLGPPVAGGVNHPAILAAPRLVILDEGPDCPPGAPVPAWCEVLLEVPGLLRPLRAYSVHLPADAAADQLPQAQRLAGRIAGRRRDNGELAIAGGDWNSYARADGLTPQQLAAQPGHLRPVRMHQAPDGTLTANHDVHDTLTSVGLADAAEILFSRHPDPRLLAPTAAGSRTRIDRFYLTPELASAAISCTQLDTGGSDHHALLLTIDLTRAARDTLSGTLPQGTAMTSRHGGQAMNPAQHALYMTFTASYRDLGETDALFLRQMCWIPQEYKDASGHVDTGLAAAASGKPPSQARDALERLTTRFLLDRSGDDEFRLHASHEEFIRHLPPGTMREKEREDVLARLRAWRRGEDSR